MLYFDAQKKKRVCVYIFINIYTAPHRKYIYCISTIGYIYYIYTSATRKKKNNDVYGPFGACIALSGPEGPFCGYSSTITFSIYNKPLHSYFGFTALSFPIDLP